MPPYDVAVLHGSYRSWRVELHRFTGSALLLLYKRECLYPPGVLFHFYAEFR